MSQIDMKQLYETINQKTLKKLETYDSILLKCHHRILYHSNLQRTYCFYQIPEFIIGVPIYSIDELKKYIINSLTKNGFKILYIEPNWLFIHWEVKPIKELSSLQKPNNNNNNKIIDNSYKSTDTYKPSGNFIYDNSSLMNMGNKFLS